MSLPGVSNILEAEAWGLKLAIQLATKSHVQPKTARACGDSAPIIKYAAGQGHLRKQSVVAILEAPLANLAKAGWTFNWETVERSHNSAAPDRATLARENCPAQAAAARDPPCGLFNWFPLPAPARGLIPPPHPSAQLDPVMQV